MIKKFNKSPLQINIDEAIKELKNNNNNCVSFIYDNQKVKSEGILAGVPITVKNLFATNDAVTDASCNFLKDFNPGYNATIIDILKENGASIVAKVNLDELALGGTGLYSSYGIIKNPLNNLRMTGGSSSGSAATFTKRIGASIGSDTGDSIRIPASYNGLTGFKPSYGAISRRGMFPYASSLDTVGYFTHNVYDSAIISSVLFKEDLKDSTSRKIDFNLENIKMKKPKTVSYLYFKDLTKDYVEKPFLDLIEKLKKENIKVKKIEIDEKIMETLPIIYKIISFSEVASNNSNLSGLLFGNTINDGSWSKTMIKTRSKGFGKIATVRMIMGSLFLSGINQTIYLEKAQKIRRVVSDLYSKILSECDVLIFPTSGNIAPKIKDSNYNISSVISTKQFASDILLAANLLGSPSISVPLGKDRKMPFGLSIDAEIYKDEELLSFSLYIEKLIGFNNG